MLHMMRDIDDDNKNDIEQQIDMYVIIRSRSTCDDDRQHDIYRGLQ